MWCVVGLGNPGEQYAKTRHNVGFQMLDALLQDQHTPHYGFKFQSDCFKGDIDHQPCLLLRPHTFMNLSGQAVGEATRYFKIPSEKTLVIHDDIDLEFGKVKVKIGGSHGGHNGLKSVDQHIGNDYFRLRIGVGRPTGQMDVSDFVLHSFDKEEQKEIDILISHMVELFPLLLEKHAEQFMQDIAKRMIT